MTGVERLTLRDALVRQQSALIGTLCAAAVEEQAFVALLADVETAIAAVDAELTEGEGGP
jgi:hypothetical protein